MTESRGIPGRPVRQPVSQRKVLSAPKRPGYVRRWVNDTEGRVNLFTEGGWLPVENKEGLETANKSKLVEAPLGSIVSRHVGNGMKAVLMEIKEEFYQEDQAAKADQISATEKDILSNRSEGQYGDIKVQR